MFDAVESVILDLLEWVANGERSYDEVMDAQPPAPQNPT